MWYEGRLPYHTSPVSTQFWVIIVTFDLSQHRVWTRVPLLLLAIQRSGPYNGPSWTWTSPNWSQPNAFYCLYNSSPVEGLHRNLWNELQQTMWVTTMKANKAHHVGWGKQPACVGTDHHIWLELMSMWLNLGYYLGTQKGSETSQGTSLTLFQSVLILSTYLLTQKRIHEIRRKGCLMITSKSAVNKPLSKNTTYKPMS